MKTLADLEALDEVATPAPWDCLDFDPSKGCKIIANKGWVPVSPAIAAGVIDGELIVALRNAAKTLFHAAYERDDAVKASAAAHIQMAAEIKLRKQSEFTLAQAERAFEIINIKLSENQTRDELSVSAMWAADHCRLMISIIRKAANP